MPATRGPLYDDNNIYVGRASSMTDFHFGDILIDELEFWQAPLDFLLLKSFAYASSIKRRYFPLEGIQDGRLYGNASVVAQGKVSKSSGVKGKRTIPSASSVSSPLLIPLAVSQRWAVIGGKEA